MLLNSLPLAASCCCCTCPVIPTQKVAERILDCTLIQDIAPKCKSVAQLPSVIQALCTALCPLMDAALPAEGSAAAAAAVPSYMTQPAAMTDLETCSTLLHCISCHMFARHRSEAGCREDTMHSTLLNCLQASGGLVCGASRCAQCA